jgi:glycosyltransferase EpsF
VESWLLSLFAVTRGREVRHHVLELGPSPGSLGPLARGRGACVWHCPLRPVSSFPARLSRVQREVGFDAVHSHVHFASGYLLALARRLGVPIRVAHAHTTRDGHGATPARLAYRAFGRHLLMRHSTAGAAASRECAAALFGADFARDRRFRVIHNGIDLASFAGGVSRDATRDALGIPAGAIVVGQVGRFDAVKNQAFTLTVAPELVRLEPRVRFLFVGDGPLRTAAEQRAAELGLGSRCIFVSAVPSDVPRLLLGGMDVVVCPSLWEGLPVALVEAQAAGLPVLASSVITREVEAVPGLVRFLDLAAGPEAWAAATARASSLPRPSPAAAQAFLAGTDFDIRNSAVRVLDLYASS